MSGFSLGALLGLHLSVWHNCSIAGPGSFIGLLGDAPYGPDRDDASKDE